MKLDRLIYSAIILHLLAVLFYYSPISLTGWWSDVIFMCTTILLLALVHKKIQYKLIKIITLISCVLNAVVATLPLALWSVKYIPNGKFDNPETYAYWTSRGDMGLNSACYGQVHKYHQISWLPFLEIESDFIPCDDLGYESWMEDR